MTRMGKLQKIRRIEWLGGLRDVAGAQAQVSRLADVASRLDTLIIELPGQTATDARKSEALARIALIRASRIVAERHEAELLSRAVALDTSRRLQARLDAVTRVMAGKA